MTLCRGSEVLGHLMSDAHDRTTKFPTVPIHFLLTPQPGERAWTVSGEDPVELDSSPTLRNDLRGGAQGSLALLKYFYS